MGSNYILITIDALRADHLNIYGYKRRITTPVIDQFARQSDIYLNAYACGVPTYLSFPSIFCSIYPSKVMRSMYLPKNIPTFVELLKNRGFRTAAFIDNSSSCSSLLGYGRGFDLVDDYFVESLRSSQRTNINFSTIPRIIHSIGRSIPFFRFLEYLISAELIQPETNTKQMIYSAIKFMKSQRGGFFVWLHFMDVHYPYSFPNYRNPLKRYKALKETDRVRSSIPGGLEYAEETVQLIEGMYDMSIRRLDAKLEVLFDSLQKEGILENTYIFITSDHGEELLKRGTLTHHENVYQEVTHVPLIIKKPSSEEPFESQRMVSLLDIPPTILKNEKIPVPKEYEGGSIFQGKRNYAISETVVPCLHKLASNWEDCYKVQFNNFVYSIRDERYTVVYDRDNRYKFFDRKDDALEEKEIKVPNNDLNDLLSSLREHQLNSLSTDKEGAEETIEAKRVLERR